MGQVPPSANNARSSAEALVPELQEVSVLVVDDEADTRDLLASLLSHAGFTVATAANGLEALAALRAIRPQMILLDIQMPIMDGAVFREAQRRDKELIRIPTVVMTGSKEEPTLDVGV